jgi:hypothetical protein
MQEPDEPEGQATLLPEADLVPVPERVPPDGGGAGPGPRRDPTKPIIGPLPDGYTYYVARYADVILQTAFESRLSELLDVLDGFHPTLDELRRGGGGRTVFVARFDAALAAHSDGDTKPWGKRNIEISSLIDGEPRYTVRGHEIDMFGAGHVADPFPGVAVEMEWNNKDPFFDRDLVNFQALHREGAIAVGVIVTRGPTLQRLLAPTVRSKDNGFKYGQSSTHWDKLIPRVHLGGGGECPLFLVGIEPERITGVEVLKEAAAKLAKADDLNKNWRTKFKRYADAKPEIKRLRDEALALVPPVDDEVVAGGADDAAPDAGAEAL